MVFAEHVSPVFRTRWTQPNGSSATAAAAAGADAVGQGTLFAEVDSVKVLAARKNCVVVEI